MIILLISLLKTSLGNEVIYSKSQLFYHAEVRTLCTQKGDNSSLALSLRTSMFSPPDSFYLSIDRAIVNLGYQGFEIFIGRECISWGYGMFYSPFSYARSKMSPFDEELLKTGKNIAGVRYNNITFMTPEFIVFLPERSPERDNTKIGLRTTFFTGNLELHTPLVFSRDSIFSGFGARFSLLDFTLFVDYSLTYRAEELLMSSVLGFNKFVGNNLYIQAEYFYNQKGLSTEEYDNLSPENLMKNLSPGYTGRHYLFSTLQWTNQRESTISFYSIIQPFWKSGLAGLSFSNCLFENSMVIFNLIRVIKGREFEWVPSKYIYSLEFRYYF
ncbi:MAG: hypothetical protein U9N06_06155 [candidate division WOR-3 bacterium]|nr:hypothetical protein [candidate division WOR-3 bacterium]